MARLRVCGGMEWDCSKERVFAAEREKTRRREKKKGGGEGIRVHENPSRPPKRRELRLTDTLIGPVLPSKRGRGLAADADADTVPVGGHGDGPI